jgi:hypothetical protein
MAVVTGNGIVITLHRRQRHGAVDDSGHHLGLQHQGAIIAVDCQLKAPEIGQSDTAVVKAFWHVGLDCQRPVEGLNGFFGPSRGLQRHAVIHQGAQVIGRNLQRVPKIIAGFRRLALLQPHQPHIEAGAEQARIGLQYLPIEAFRPLQLSLPVKGDGLFGHGFQIQNFHVALSFLPCPARLSSPAPRPGRLPEPSC